MDASGSATPTSFRRRTAGLLFGVILLLGISGASVNAAAPTTLYGPFSDGCYYLWNGVEYIEVQCPQTDGSVDFYVPSVNGWEFAMKVIPLGGGSGIVKFADGTRVDLASDGTLTIYATNGGYGRFASDGTLIEGGYVDSQGIMIQTTGRSRGTLRPQVLSNLGSNVFNPLTAAQDLTDYNACLQLGNTSTDYDYDYNTGFNELAEHCAP